MNRRQLLAMASLLPGLSATGQLYAAPRSPGRFLLVFLRGGYDCANLLVPYSSHFYYESRPNIAIARPDPTLTTGALALDSDWALAPAVRDSIGSLWAARQAAFIPFAGTSDASRSHFETQNTLELGQSAATHDFRSGLLARLAAVTQDATPIAFTDAMPLAFQGAAEIPNISLNRVSRAAFDERQAQILEDMYADHRLGAAVTDGLELRREVAQTFDAEMKAANHGAATPKGFEAEAGRIGQLMRDQYSLGFVDVGGWDTHVNQGGAQGVLGTNLGNLGRGLKSFSEALGDRWNSTVVLVVSEFGRTFRENGNKGTDHGHGCVYWVLGGGLSGGRIAGAQARVDSATLFQNRDYPVLNDFRSIFGGLVSRIWGLSARQLATVVPGAKPFDLGLI